MKNKGIALIFSLIIVNIALAVGLTVFSLIVGGFPLADIVKNSQKAFYAADAGAECAFYWDRQDAFKPVAGTISCLEKNDVALLFNEDDNIIFDLNLENDSCVDVTVDKSGASGFKTVITANGHSGCDPGTANRVERTIRYRFR